MKLKTRSLLIIAVVLALVVALAVFLLRKREGYTHSILGQQCAMSRSPVDYISDPKMNPHYQADPGAWRQPLEHGVDVHREYRDNPNLDAQYRGDWQGAGNGMGSLTNDSKTRFDLTNAGNLQAVRDMDGVDIGSDPHTETHNTYTYQDDNHLGD